MVFNEKNLEKIWNEYYPKVYGYYYRRVNQRFDVEDLTMITMEIFIKSITEKEITNQNAYLWKIAHNQLLIFIANKNKTFISISSIESIEEIEINRSIEVLLSDNYLNKIEALKECIKNQLIGQQFEIVNLSIIDDLKSSQVSKQLSITPENVRQILSRALKKLRLQCRQVWQS
jgi:RNA polymerase sigma factor (sigma-70 family)